MPLLFFGFVFLLLSLMWVVWTLTLLFWPLVLLIAAAVFLRAQTRYWQRMTGSSPAPRHQPAASGRNAAFEEYRRETLNRLDEESGMFREFLERMRKSRDKREFEAFLAARRGRTISGPQGSVPAV